MKKELEELINKFLSTRVENTTGGWTEVEKSEIKQLNEIFTMIIDEKYERDCDNSPTIQYQLINRQKEFSNFIPSPYPTNLDSLEDAEEYLHIAEYNLERSTEYQNQINRRLKSLSKEQKRLKKMAKLLKEDGLKRYSSCIVNGVAGYVISYEMKDKQEFIDNTIKNIRWIEYDVYKRYPEDYEGPRLFSNNLGTFKNEDITLVTKENKNEYNELMQNNVDCVVPTFLEETKLEETEENIKLITLMALLKLEFEEKYNVEVTKNLLDIEDTIKTIYSLKNKEQEEYKRKIRKKVKDLSREKRIEERKGKQKK